MVDPKEISSREEFDENKLNSYTYVTIGGNHLWSAIQQAVEEDEKLKDVMGKINVHIYVAPNEIEARHIGNVHNIRCKTLDFTFQDKVYQARKLIDRSVSNIAKMLTDMEMKDVQTTSASTVANIANMMEDSFKEVVKIYCNYETVNGPEKSFPVQFFRSLQGVSESLQLTYLRKVAGDIKSVSSVTAEIEKLKKRTSL